MGPLLWAGGAALGDLRYAMSGRDFGLIKDEKDHGGWNN
jgi:hypothetical protein